MKLRTDKDGHDYVVPEAGELAALTKALAFLDKAAVIVGGTSQTWMTRVAADLQQVIDGDAPGVMLPKKRQSKQDAGGQAASDTEPESHAVEVRVDELPPKCSCGNFLSPREIRSGTGKCRMCATVEPAKTEEVEA